MVAECKECGWEGDEDMLEYFRCPSCGSRNLKTGSGRTEERPEPPEDAMTGGMGA